MGNVTRVATTFNRTQTDNQVFCYDELNRLTWAGSTGTSPCKGAVSSGTLTSAYYTASYSYDPEGRLTSSPVGSYTYGDSSHMHAATAVGGSYTATYDAAGDMVCRAPTSSATCAGTQTGTQLSYDNEGRLLHWQNAPSSPTSTADFAYDGEGNRVGLQSTQGGPLSTTYYLLGGLEKVGNGGRLTKG